jgi:hypothetical protein
MASQPDEFGGEDIEPVAAAPDEFGGEDIEPAPAPQPSGYTVTPGGRKMPSGVEAFGRAVGSGFMLGLDQPIEAAARATFGETPQELLEARKEQGITEEPSWFEKFKFLQARRGIEAAQEAERYGKSVGAGRAGGGVLGLMGPAVVTGPAKVIGTTLGKAAPYVLPVTVGGITASTKEGTIGEKTAYGLGAAALTAGAQKALPVIERLNPVGRALTAPKTAVGKLAVGAGVGAIPGLSAGDLEAAGIGALTGLGLSAPAALEVAAARAAAANNFDLANKLRKAAMGVSGAGAATMIGVPAVTGTPEERAEALTYLAAMGAPLAGGALAERSIRRTQERVGGLREAAAPQAKELIETQRKGLVDEAVEAQRKAEKAQYEAEIERLTNAELETRKRARLEQDAIQRQALEDQANQEKQQRAQAQAQLAKATEAELEASRRTLEDDQLSLAQEQADLTAENKIWNDKNKRAFEAVKREQQIVAEAERMATADRAAQEKEIAALQQELAAVRALEERLQTDTDPSLQGMVAKKFQDMYNRLNTAMEIMRQGGQEIPPAYVNAFDTVSESYLRNTKKGGYVGFGPDTELFIEDPIQWKERKRAEMVAKAQAEGGVLDQRIADALDVLANTQVDYLARARQAKTLPDLPPDVIRDIFAIQDLQYTGGDLFSPQGTRIPQPLMGGRIPDAPFTSAESMQRSITNRRAARDRATTSRDARKAAEAALPRGKTITQLQREARLAALRAQPAPTGVSAKQEVRAAMEAATPRPAGMTEADIVAREGIPDLAEFQRRQMEAARRDVMGEEQITGRPVTPRVIGPLTPTTDVMGPSPLRSYLGSRRGGMGVAVANVQPRELGLLDLVEPQMSKNPEQTRMKFPAQAVALADAYQQVLAQNQTLLKKWTSDIQQRGLFASLLRFVKENPDKREELNKLAEEKFGADLAERMGYQSVVRGAPK